MWRSKVQNKINPKWCQQNKLGLRTFKFSLSFNYQNLIWTIDRLQKKFKTNLSISFAQFYYPLTMRPQISHPFITLTSIPIRPPHSIFPTLRPYTCYIHQQTSYQHQKFSISLNNPYQNNTANHPNMSLPKLPTHYHQMLNYLKLKTNFWVHSNLQYSKP